MVIVEPSGRGWLFFLSRLQSLLSLQDAYGDRHIPTGLPVLFGGGPQRQAGRLGFFQTPGNLFLSWKDQECNITSIALELFLLGHFRCFKFQISLPGQEELKQPTARLLFPAPDSVSPQPPAELHLRKENYHPPGWAT